MTYESDYSGDRWFYPFEQLSGGISQEATSRNRGIKIEDFAFLYFTASGTLVTTQERIRRKLLITRCARYPFTSNSHSLYLER